MSASLTWLYARNYRRERWRNQQGWTREILRVPAIEAFDWRASIAEINQNTLFSPFPGYRRTQVLLHGEGLRLSFADGREMHLGPPHEKTTFDGADLASCQLSAGPVQVFNAIWDPDRIELEVLHRPLVGSLIFPGTAGVQWLLHLLAGRARIAGSNNDELAAGDSLWLRGNANQRTLLEGTGEALVLRLIDRAAAQTSSRLSLLPKPPEEPDA